jgi:thiol-disulfide isomerase/thioredoxin
MIKVSVFGKKECDACKAAVEKITYFSDKWGMQASTAIDFIDMETVDGLAEGAYRDVYDIPTVILEEEGRELARWVKKVPESREFRGYFMRDTLDGGSGDKRIC